MQTSIFPRSSTLFGKFCSLLLYFASNSLFTFQSALNDFASLLLRFDYLRFTLQRVDFRHFDSFPGNWTERPPIKLFTFCFRDDLDITLSLSVLCNVRSVGIWAKALKLKLADFGKDRRYQISNEWIKLEDRRQHPSAMGDVIKMVNAKR